MANKKNNSTHTTEKKYIDLFYMTPSEVSAKDIASLIQEEANIKVELWEAMNILELELSNQNSVDFEPMEVSFKAPSDVAFVKNRNIKTIFAITLCETDLNSIMPLFERIIEKHSGFLCADSEDFSPVYAGSSKR
jgi:hypothetical protein